MKTNTKIALFAAAVGMFLLIRKNKSEGVGKVERIKRRIYKEVSMAQGKGVDFSKKFPDLTSAERDALRDVGESVGWKQSKRSLDSGKSYVESYYNSLRRAWNAVSGTEGVGRAWSVKDADGNVVLTWIEDAAAHVEAERRTLEAEARAVEARKSLQRAKRAAAKAASEPITTKTIQQQILEKVPYLRIMDDPFNPRSNDPNFSLVLWKTQKDRNGEVMYEGAAMAFTDRSAAEDAKRFMKGEARGYLTKEWEEYYREMSGRLNWRDLRDGATVTIKDVSKIDINKISGIGGIKVTDVLEPELLEYIRTNIDPDEVAEVMDKIDQYRIPLSQAGSDVQASIQELVNDWCDTNGVDPDDIWSVVDEEDILWEL